jgi:hypothetical protein
MTGLTTGLLPIPLGVRAVASPAKLTSHCKIVISKHDALTWPR